MSKVLFVITSSDEKFDYSMVVVYNSMKFKRYEDMKVIFFGPSQKRLTQLDGNLKEMFQELINNKVVDSACIGVAELLNIKPQLERLGVPLMRVGERIAEYIKQGYEVITF